MTLRWREIVPIALAGLLGIAASFLLYGWSLRQDDERVNEQIRFRAEWRATDLAWKMESSGQIVASLAALIAADPDVTLERLRRIDATPLRRLQGATAVGWAPRVLKEDRERFEAEVRGAGLSGFRILESRAGTLAPASEREEYLPLLHAWIFEGTPAPPGLDALADPAVAAAAQAARDSGTLATTLPLRSVVTGLVTIQPVAAVYAGAGTPATVEERRARLRGHVIGRVPLVAALNRAVANTPDLTENIYLSSANAAGEMRSFAEYRAKEGAFVASDAAIDLASRPGSVVVLPIRVLNTEWIATFHFPPEAVAARRASGLWMLLLAGLIATAAVVAFFGHEARQTARSERLVRERTTDLRRESGERMKAEQTASAIIEQSPFAIIGVRPDRHVMLWNEAAARIFGYAAEEVLGSPYPLVPPEGQAEFDRIIGRVSSGEKLVDIEVRRRRKDGRLIDIVFSGAPVYDAENELTMLVFVLQDVTERRAIEAQLRQSQRMEAIGQLSGGIAHDINNTLGAIIGNLEVILDEKRDIGAIHRLTETAIGVAERGGQLMQRLLAFARRQMLAPELIEVRSIVDGIVPVLRRTIGESIAIEARCDSDVWPVRADPAQLESALLNLAINARDAMPQGGALTIMASNVAIDADLAPLYPDLAPGDYVVLAVADTGTGMPPEIAAKAFEPFFTTKETGKGTGLGLSMVYGFLRQSGGSAKIYSEPGHGTTVHLYLPRAEVAQEPTSAKADDAAEPPRGAERVLVVEDNPDLRTAACRMLTGLGYEVTQASDAAEALRVLGSDAAFDLLFSDVVMPGMSGLDLALQVRLRNPAIKILLTSGFASPVAILDQARDKGFPILGKPYRRAVLAAKVREVLGDAIRARA